MEDIIFSLDPGSKKTGWCVMGAREQLIQAGLLLPDKQSTAPEFRIHRMCEDLRNLLDELQPAVIVIEWTSGKVGRKRHGGQGAGLAIYGISVGSLWREVLAWRRALPAEQQLEVKVELVLENVWTRGIPKRKRIEAVSAAFPQYNPEQDRGGDVADAIGLACFYLRERLLRAADLVKAQDEK